MKDLSSLDHDKPVGLSLQPKSHVSSQLQRNTRQRNTRQRNTRQRNTLQQQTCQIRQRQQQ